MGLRLAAAAGQHGRARKFYAKAREYAWHCARTCMASLFPQQLCQRLEIFHVFSHYLHDHHDRHADQHSPDTP